MSELWMCRRTILVIDHHFFNIVMSSFPCTVETVIPIVGALLNHKIRNVHRVSQFRNILCVFISNKEDVK